MAALEQQILPALPASLKREGAMVVQGLRILRRHLELGPENEAEEREVLTALVRPDGECTTVELNWRLVQMIRGGKFDGPEKLQEILTAGRHLTNLKLKENNPRFLENLS